MLTRRSLSLLTAGLLAASGPVSAPRAQEPRPGAQLPTLPVTQIDDRPRAADLDAPRRLSLSFAEPVTVRDVLLLLVRDTPFSLALDPEVAGTFIGELKEMTLRQAIEAVLAPQDLEFEARGTFIHVFARRTETRLFDLNVLNVQRAWQRGVATGDGTTLNAGAGLTDPLEDIGKGIDSLLSPAGRSHLDRRAGLVQVTDYVDRLDRIGVYVEALHLRATRQVRVEARVLDVALKNANGIDWRAVRQKLGIRTPGPSAGLSVADTSALQDALAAQGDVRVIASTDVTALNNEPAVMRVGTPDVSWLTLTVIAQIAADGIIQVSVSPSWSERSDETRTVSGKATPAMQVAEADTVSRVVDGETIVFAGLLRAGTTARPSSGFATLFGSPAKPVATGRELVLLITPTVVTPGGYVVGSRQ